VTLDEIRRHAVDELARLPAALKSLEDAAAYPVEIAPALLRLAEQIDRATTTPAVNERPV
jgi:nicotinate phosphoribosyltransferase